MEKSTISLTSLFAILWGRRWVVAIVAGITVAIAIVINVTSPPIYTATATVVVDFDKAVGDQLDSPLAAGLQQSYLTTQLGIMGSHHVAAKVVDRLELQSNTKWQNAFLDATGGVGSARDWIANAISDSLLVVPGKNSRLVNINYTASDPVVAAQFANAFAAAYEETNLEMNTGPARREAEQLNQMLGELREDLGRAQSKLGAYQREHGILLTDERLDIETEKLRELVGRQILAEAERRALDSKIVRIEGLAASGKSLDALPEVLANNVVRDLKAQLGAKEAEFADIRRQLGRNHPQYKSAAAEIAVLRAKLDTEVKSIASSILSEVEQAEARAATFREAEDAQRAKVMELKQARDHVPALVRELESARENYDSGLERYNRFMAKSRLSQTNVTLLNPALAPSEASNPKLFRTAFLAGILGLMLGFAVAIIWELLDRRIRSQDDLNELSDGVILGGLPRYSR